MSQENQRARGRLLAAAIISLITTNLIEPFLLNLHSLWYWPYVLAGIGVGTFSGAIVVLRVQRLARPYVVALAASSVYLFGLIENALWSIIANVVSSGIPLLSVSGLILFLYPTGLLLGLIYLQVSLVWLSLSFTGP